MGRHVKGKTPPSFPSADQLLSSAANAAPAHRTPSLLEPMADVVDLVRRKKGDVHEMYGTGLNHEIGHRMTAIEQHPQFRRHLVM